jgi:hypothetical protein
MSLPSVFLVALFCLHAFNGQALIRRSPIPQLHSILDSPEKAKPYADDDGWSRRLTAGPKPNEIRLMRYKATRSDLAERGKTFAIIGGILLASGGALLLYSDAEERRAQAAGTGSYTGIYAAVGAVVGLAGTVFVSIGLPMWLVYR